VTGAGSWWDRRSERERRVVARAAAILAIALAALAWIETARARTRLNAELPQLRASIAALARDAAEVKRLRALPVTSGAASQQSPQAQLATLATNGGGLAGAQITVLDDKRAKVIGIDIAFASLLEFLQNAQVTHGMRVESARLEALPAVGRVRAELTLTRS
jgi:type II secretory pathway component PulM